MKKFSLMLCGILAVLLMSCKGEKKVEFPLYGAQLTITTLENEIMDYTGTLDPAVVTFNADGTYAGTLGCNGVNGQFTYGETDFKFNGVNTTKMACSEEGNAYEARVKSILERVNAYEVLGEKLLLKEGDNVLAIAEKNITIEKTPIDTIVEDTPVVEEEKPAAKKTTTTKKTTTESTRPSVKVKVGDKVEVEASADGKTAVSAKQGDVNAATSGGNKVTVTAGSKKAAIQARQQEEANANK